MICDGRHSPGDAVRVLPSGKTLDAYARIVTQDGDLEEAVAGQSVTLTPRRRGRLLARRRDRRRGAPPQVADQFEATLVWMSDEALLPGRPYWLKLGDADRFRDHPPPKYQVNVNTLEHLAAKTLRAECHRRGQSVDRPAASCSSPMRTTAISAASS